MLIVGIFAIINDNLLSVRFNGKPKSEFRMLFDNWQNPEYLEQFFEENKSDLQNGFYDSISVEDAIYQTIEESEKMETIIKKIAVSVQGFSSDSSDDLLFENLNSIETSINRVKSKVKGPKYKSWLRLYAIRMSPNHYIVTGGAIKLTRVMKGRNHLEKELDKLNATIEYLKENGVLTNDDYELITIRNHER